MPKSCHTLCVLCYYLTNAHLLYDCLCCAPPPRHTHTALCAVTPQHVKAAGSKCKGAGTAAAAVYGAALCSDSLLLVAQPGVASLAAFSGCR
jgi:hypothetical protein